MRRFCIGDLVRYEPDYLGIIQGALINAKVGDIGIVIDDNFKENNHRYLVYSDNQFKYWEIYFIVKLRG
jgi:hypothetical protein